MEANWYAWRSTVKCGQSVNRIYSKDAILKNPSSLTEDRKNVKPIHEPLFRPKATPPYFSGDIVPLTKLFSRQKWPNQIYI